MKEVEIHTDGSCLGNPGPGGWAAVLRYQGRERELCGGEALTTNNRMELLAVIEALGSLKRRCTVTLYTDSAYVKNGITAWIHNWKARGWRTADGKPVKNIDLWQRLDAARAQRHPVVRRAGDDHRLGVAGEDEAGNAELAGLREHVGGQRVAQAERALGDRVAGGRRDDHRVVDVAVERADRRGAGALVAQHAESGLERRQRDAVDRQHLLARGREEQIDLRQPPGQRQRLGQAVARTRQAPGEARTGCFRRFGGLTRRGRSGCAACGAFGTECCG